MHGRSGHRISAAWWELVSEERREDTRQYAKSSPATEAIHHSEHTLQSRLLSRLVVVDTQVRPPAHERSRQRELRILEHPPEGVGNARCPLSAGRADCFTLRSPSSPGIPSLRAALV